MKYLYGASVQGIQEFIFQTNKLKEIGGASELVEQICTNKFIEEAKITANDPNIIINAAGNIKYLFDDKEKCEALTLKFPKVIAEFAPGISISQAVVKFDFQQEKLADAINKLENKLKTQRNIVQNPIEIGFMGLERARRTGGVGIKYVANEVADSSIIKKTAAFDLSIIPNENSITLYQKFFGNDLKKAKIPFDLNQLTKNASKAWMAVIHADGNGVGMLVQKLATALKNKTNEEAKGVFSTFSKQLDAATQAAASKAFQKLQTKADEKYPIRPIILGGDDMTLIIRADLALNFANNFLIEFEKETKYKLGFLSEFGVSGFENGLTACAGIAYIKDSYPIHYGLHLAEELTKKAKQASKRDLIEGELPPSSLSFYKVHSSFVEDLKTIEEQTLKTKEVSFDYGPYFISSDKGPKVKELTDKLEVIDQFKDDKSKGVSKLRQWISELYKDKSTADFMLKRIEQVNNKFFQDMQLKNAIVNHKSIIYDVLQLHSLN